jgi:Tol biopolymer transport system component
MPAPLSALARMLPRIAFTLVALLVVAEPLASQYFGRNQVQYRTFDFQILRTEHFDVYYYPEAEEAARDAARMAERWYARLSQILNHEFEERQPLILFATHPDFQQTTIAGGGIPEGTQAFAEPFQQRIVMPLTGSYEDTDHLVGHELVHAFQFDISGLGRAGGGIEAAARRFQAPLWFIEGMAEYLSLGPIDPQTAMWLRDAALTGEIPSVERMTRDPRVFPYRWGHAFWAYVGGRWGDAVIGQILRQVGQGVPYPEAFQRILNVSLDDISADWETAIRRTYLPLVADAREAREEARPLVTRRGEGGRINIGPAVSPDGRWVAFISELTGLDIELFLADAETGEVVRRLQRGSAFDPHVRSIRFIRSAGAWSPDSRQFVLSAQRGEGDVLIFLDAERGGTQRTIRVPGIREITNPDWSPDGRSIAFSGVQGGLSDIYILDLETESVRRLTSDRYAALHPSFSPDGSTLAYVTDRGPGTDLATLAHGGHRVALLDVETGEYRPLPEIGGAKTFNPQWTRDGAGLYMISDRGGVPNIYRLDIASGELFQVTDLFTGAAGITDMSPAMSVARGANRMVFSAYEDGGYNLYSITTADRLAGEPVPTTVAADDDEDGGRFLQYALLPPSPRPAEPAFNRVLMALRDHTTGLPTAGEMAAAEVDPYRARLQLDYLGQPQVGVAVGGMHGGGGLQGGVTGLFSDMLGHHTLFATIQANGLIDEVGFNTTYLYTRQRWNYGVAVQRIPMVGAFYGQDVGEIDGQPVFLDQLIRYRIFDWALQGVAQYPFSEVHRVEFGAGARRIVESPRILENVYPIVDGQIIPQIIGQRERTEDGFSFNFAEGSAALVYDNALFGFTSPFAGQRYRFELNPMVGQIQMTNALADYRRYVWLRPFTVAARGYHLGRYGRDAEGLFRDLILGQEWSQWRVRGYSPGDVVNECRQQPGTGCPVLEEMQGSRLAMGSAELRFPLIRQVVVGAGLGLPPIEGFLFGDGGVAWRDGVSPTFSRGRQADEGRHGLYTSIGAGARINVFGLLILEAAYVNPLDRPRGWHWQFAMQPGF